MAVSIWETRAQELVGIGDMVALSVLAHSDAVGRIVAEAADKKIQCVLVRGSNCKPGDFVTVDAEQLLVRVYR